MKLKDKLFLKKLIESRYKTDKLEKIFETMQFFGYYMLLFNKKDFYTGYLINKYPGEMLKMFGVKKEDFKYFVTRRKKNLKFLLPKKIYMHNFLNSEYINMCNTQAAKIRLGSNYEFGNYKLKDIHEVKDIAGYTKWKSTIMPVILHSFLTQINLYQVIDNNIDKDNSKEFNPEYLRYELLVTEPRHNFKYFYADGNKIFASQLEMVKYNNEYYVKRGNDGILG